jgi:hypothetical protein
MSTEVEQHVTGSRPAPVHAPLLGRHVDHPKVGPVAGDLIVSGWALSSDGPCRRVAAVSNRIVVGHVRPDRRREDITTAFPETPGSDRCGFRLRIPALIAGYLRELEIVADTPDGTAAHIWTIALSGAEGRATDTAQTSQSPRAPRWRRRRRERQDDSVPGDSAPGDSSPAAPETSLAAPPAGVHPLLPSELRIVALISAFNEGDMIGWVIDHLAANRVHSYLIDDGSTDDTVEVAKQRLGRGLLGLEETGRETDARTSWRRILERKVDLARELGADWYLHHDADEIRESPFPGLSLAEAICWVDRLGYNALDFRVFNFRPVDDLFRPGQDPRAHLTRWEDPAEYDRRQRKGWKAGSPDIVLADGGHDAQFESRRVFPIRFLLRHYPIRSPAHGRRKVFGERQNRFVQAETGIGWHRQYDSFLYGDPTFLWNPAQLRAFDLDQLRLEALIEAGAHAAERTPDASDPARPVPEVAHDEARGHLDVVSPAVISGWAAVPADDADAIEVDLWDGNRHLATVRADGYRPDLEEVGFGGGAGGFRLRPPGSLLDGNAHWIWATIAGTGTPLARCPLVLQSNGRLSMGQGSVQPAGEPLC